MSEIDVKTAVAEAQRQVAREIVEMLDEPATSHYCERDHDTVNTALRAIVAKYLQPEQTN
ncbi:MAG TPA: hypothetical protein VE974_06240 [Thermoanaerobaculia bacterium]|nr:hypothetical protein [Thermoanaerobaculia bacterium]